MEAEKDKTTRKNWLKKCAVQQYATADVKFASVLILPIIYIISVCTHCTRAPTSVSIPVLHYMGIFAYPICHKTHTFQQNLA